MSEQETIHKLCPVCGHEYQANDADGNNYATCNRCEGRNPAKSYGTPGIELKGAMYAACCDAEHRGKGLTEVCDDDGFIYVELDQHKRDDDALTVGTPTKHESPRCQDCMDRYRRNRCAPLDKMQMTEILSENKRLTIDALDYLYAKHGDAMATREEYAELRANYFGDAAQVIAGLTGAAEYIAGWLKASPCYTFAFDEDGDEPTKYLVPPAAVPDIGRFCANNEFDADDVERVIALEVGEEIVYGGGAVPISRLRRVR